jgi:hypothetical protein
MFHFEILTFAIFGRVCPDVATGSCAIWHIRPKFRVCQQISLAVVLKFVALKSLASVRTYSNVCDMTDKVQKLRVNGNPRHISLPS